MSAEIIYLAKRNPETQVRLAVQNVGLIVKKFNGGYLLRLEDGEILPGHFGPDEDGIIDTYFGELLPWSAEEVLDYCAMFQEGMKTGKFAIG